MVDDVDNQYERIFGKEQYPNVFPGDDAEYVSLRQEIINSKREYNPKKVLPFKGVALLSYDDYKRARAVRSIEETGYRVFYLRRYEKGRLVVNAAGYFKPKSSAFVVLKDSFFHNTFYGLSLLGKISLKGSPTNASLYESGAEQTILMSDLEYASASLAASVFLGKESDFKEWKDKRGKFLSSYFSYYKSEGIEERELASFPDRVAGDMAPCNKPQFFISKDGVYAFGYLKDGYFYICKGSRVAVEEDERYVNSNSSNRRKRFLSEACVRFGNYYLVNKDAKCMTASGAASYVLGSFAASSAWKDFKGVPLVCSESLNPETENFTDESSALDGIDLFYIKREGEPNRACDSVGFYNTATHMFVVRANSLIAFDCTFSFAYSPSGAEREELVRQNCIKFKNYYKLKADLAFSSVSKAASFVLGCRARKDEWVDGIGLSFKCYSAYN